MTLNDRSIISNLKFIYKKEGDHLKRKLKYFQHRDDRDTHIQQHDEHGEPIRRWEDRGLGDNYNRIAQSCSQLATTGLKNDVGARTLVLSPQVEFMAAIPPDVRMAVMTELTDATVERWFEEMRLPQAEYSFVVHKGEVKSDRPDGIEQENKEFIHSHVVLAATTPGFSQERDNYKVYKEQLDDLHRVSTQEMERIWKRELGVDRVKELNKDLEQLTAELKQADLEKSQIISPDREPSQHDIDEAMLDLYEVTGLEPPEDLLGRVYESRLEQASDRDPVESLRELGFEIPDDEPNPIRDLEEMGFDFSGDTKIMVHKDVVDVARELGFEIPKDSIQGVTVGDRDILQSFRDLGFDIPDDERSSSDDLNEILDDLRDLGFEIPADDVNIESEPQPKILDLDLD